MAETTEEEQEQEGPGQKSPQPEAPAYRRVGHKGADAIAEGNTLASFEAAVDAGVDMIELDVLRDREGRLVVAHDHRDALERKPLTLSEALTAFLEPPLDEVEIDCDLKLPGREAELAGALAGHGMIERAMVSTMEISSLVKLRQLEPEQIVMEQRALDAAFRDDPGTLREALDEIGFLHDPEAIDAERLMEHVKFVGGWYMEDVELEITSERVMKMIEVTSDPRSDFYDLVRKEAVPADELMGRRMETGLLAVLAQLRATANWHRIMREWVYGDPAETVLGEADWRYFEQRGTSQTPGLTDRSRAG